MLLNEQRTEDPMEQLDAAHADRAERVAVIGVAEPQELLLRGATAELPVLERLLERDLDRRRARVRIEHARQRRAARPRAARPPSRMPGSCDSPRNVECAMRSSCIAQRLIQPRVVVAVNVAPQRADAIEVAPAVGVEEEVAVARRDHQRIPLRHLRERVPQHRRSRSTSSREIVRHALDAPRHSTAATAAIVDVLCRHGRVRRLIAQPRGCPRHGRRRMPWTNTPRSNSRALSCHHALIITDDERRDRRVARDRRARARAPRNCRVALASVRRRSSPSLPRTISSARASPPRTIIGGSAVENTSDRARFHSSFAIAGVVATNAPYAPSAFPNVPTSTIRHDADRRRDATTLRPARADRVGLVEHQRRAVLLRDRREPLDIREIAIHREQALADDHPPPPGLRAASCSSSAARSRCGNTTTCARASRQPSMMLAWLSSSENTTSSGPSSAPSVPTFAAYPDVEQPHAADAQPVRDRALELDVLAMVPGDQPRLAPAPTPVFIERRVRRLHQPRIVRERQVIVRRRGRAPASPSSVIRAPCVPSTTRGTRKPCRSPRALPARRAHRHRGSRGTILDHSPRRGQRSAQLRAPTRSHRPGPAPTSRPAFTCRCRTARTPRRARGRRPRCRGAARARSAAWRSSSATTSGNCLRSSRRDRCLQCVARHDHRRVLAFGRDERVLAPSAARRCPRSRARAASSSSPSGVAEVARHRASRRPRRGTCQRLDGPDRTCSHHHGALAIARHRRPTAPHRR